MAARAQLLAAATPLAALVLLGSAPAAPALALPRQLPDDLAFEGADGASVPVGALAVPAGGTTPALLALRVVAAWCGPCRWHATHGADLLPGALARRVKLMDVLVAGVDNGPPGPADLAAWTAAGDGAATVVGDAHYRLAPLFPRRAALPLVALVDARTLALRAVLAGPGPDAFTQALRAELARIDGKPPPPRTASALVDRRFDREAWDLIRGMALGPPASEPTNAREADPGAIDLGRALFFDGDLSPGGRKVSCGSCHQPEMLFQNGKDRAPEGIGTGSRNVPTVILATDQRWQFWDGRADSAWAQAIMPIEDPNEMASSRLYVAHVVAQKYRAPFEALFGALPPLEDASRFPPGGKPGDAAWDGMVAADRDQVNRVFAGVGKAMAAYERSLRPLPNALDRYAGGDRAALTGAEKDGLAAFLRAGCVQCHHGPRFTDDAFHALRFPTGKLDRSPDVGRAEGIPKLLASEFLRSGTYADAPMPRATVPTGPQLEGAFKTPGLRGVAWTLPYGHGGSFGGLTSVLEAHRTGGLPGGSPYTVGSVEPWLPEFDAKEIPRLETFLRALRMELSPEQLASTPR